MPWNNFIWNHWHSFSTTPSSWHQTVAPERWHAWVFWIFGRWFRFLEVEIAKIWYYISQAKHERRKQQQQQQQQQQQLALVPVVKVLCVCVWIFALTKLGLCNKNMNQQNLFPRYVQYYDTPWKFNITNHYHWNLPSQFRKGSSSNYHFPGAFAVKLRGCISFTFLAKL